MMKGGFGEDGVHVEDFADDKSVTVYLVLGVPYF